MSNIQKFFSFIGRILISLIFLYSASVKILDWQMSETVITNMICDWHAGISNSPMLESFLEFLLPYNTFILILGLTLEILGSLLIFFGFHPKVGASLLISYLLPLTLFSHRFWIGDTLDFDSELVSFLKNLSIIGGLFQILSVGSDRHKDRDSSDDERMNNPFGKSF